MATLSHCYQDWLKVDQHVLKHAEMESETQGVQSFGAKSRANAVIADPPPPPQPSSSEIKLIALIVFFRTRHESFVGLE